MVPASSSDRTTACSPLPSPWQGARPERLSWTIPAYHLEAPGATFAGRDVFAPAAAHLCNGVDLADLGTSLDSALLVPGMIALPRNEPDGIHAEVLWVDRFGNCQLNVGPDELEVLIDGQAGPDSDVVTVVCGEQRRGARRVRTFGDLATGAIGLVLDSQGMYALALDRRSAAAELALGPGDAVVLTAGDSSEVPVMPTPVDLEPAPVASLPCDLRRRSPSPCSLP